MAHIQRQLVVQADAGIVVGIEEAGIGTGHDAHAGLLQQRQHRRDPGMARVPRLDLFRRGAGGALHAPGVGLAQARADVGQVRVIGMRFAVEEAEDAAAVERGRDRDPAFGEAAIGGQRGGAVEALVQAAAGLGAVDAASGEISGDPGLVRNAGLERVVQVLDGTESGVDGLADGQRHRDVARGAQAALARLGHRVQEQLRLERAVGDLDEIDPVALFAVQRGVHAGLVAGFQGALPDRGDAFDLGAGGEQLRPEQLAVGDLRPPRQHLPGQVAGRVAHAGDAMGDVQRQQCLVFLDQRRAAAEVHVHFPQPRDQVAVARIERSARAPLAGQRRVRADRDDVAAADRNGLAGQGAGVLDIDDGGVADQHIGIQACGQCRRRQRQQRGKGEAERGVHSVRSRAGVAARTAGGEGGRHRPGTRRVAVRQADAGWSPPVRVCAARGAGSSAAVGCLHALRGDATSRCVHPEMKCTDGKQSEIE